MERGGQEQEPKRAKVDATLMQEGVYSTDCITFHLVKPDEEYKAGGDGRFQETVPPFKPLMSHQYVCMYVCMYVCK